MQQVDITKLSHILTFIDPNLSHEDWFKVLAGVKAEFGEAGRKYALEWSQSGDTFEMSSFKSSWSSARASTITFATVIHYAKEGGYHPEISNFQSISEEEVERRRVNLEVQKAAEEAAIHLRHEAAALTAQDILNKAIPVDGHPYLTKKQIPSDDFLELNGNLVIPISKDNQIVNVQQIAPDGVKKFLYGGEISECYTEFGSIPNPEIVLICEGVATGVSLNLASGKPVVIAFNSGNLSKVAKVIAYRYPNAGILICGDNDQYKDKNVGLDASKKAMSGIKKTHYILPEFADTTSKPTDFNDLMLLEGIEQVTNQVQKGVVELYELMRQASLPEGFVFRQGKVFYRSPFEENAEMIQVCSSLEVIGLSRDKNKESWGRVLKFHDMDGHEHVWSMPMEMLAGDAKELRSELLSQGLLIGSHPKSKALLRTFIQDSEPSKRFVNVPQIGWHDGIYVLPDRMLGRSTEEYVLQSDNPIEMDFSQKMNLLDWQNSISQPCQGNSRLILALSTAFAASLVSQFSIESGGIHFMGGSSLGKTTALLVASSVWGSHKRLKKWRATGNALEGVSAMSNDSLLCLDELAEMSPKDAGATAYMLANGQGKQRANKFGGSRDVMTWKLLFLSTGEISLETHIAEAGQKARAGQAVRMIEVPADTGTYGLFENLHDFSSGAEMSEHFKKQTEHCHGSAGAAFIEQFLAYKEQAVAYVEEMRTQFMSQFEAPFTSGQVNRVLARFAFIAAVGELASKLGVTGWQEGEAIRGTRACFDAWLESRGGDVNAEVEQALSQVRQFIEQHGESRFTNINDTVNTVRTINRAGYKKIEGDNVIYYFGVEVFRKEVCKGLNYKVVATVLRENGHLHHESGRLTHKTPTLEDQRRVSSYAVKSSILQS